MEHHNLMYLYYSVYYLYEPLECDLRKLLII